MRLILQSFASPLASSFAAAVLIATGLQIQALTLNNEAIPHDGADFSDEVHKGDRDAVGSEHRSERQIYKY